MGRIAIAAVSGICAAAAHAPPGHMENMFKLPNCQGLVDVREEGDLPTASEFAKLYQTKFGKPVLFKGAAKHMKAMKTFTDDAYMAEHFSDQNLGMVEFAKKETRTAGGGEMKVGEFLRRYKKDDLYTVSAVPPKMAGDVEILPFLSCSYGTNFMDINNMWWSSGGTKSVIHNDDQDNVNCLFEGQKRMIFWHPSDKAKIESIERSSSGYLVTHLTLGDYPAGLTKKVTLLKYFQNYMTEHLLNGGDQQDDDVGFDRNKDLIHMKKWLRTKTAIVFRLSNNVIQLNFFNHTKLILNTPLGLVTFINTNRQITTYYLKDIRTTNSSDPDVADMINRMAYALDVLDSMIKPSATK